MLKRRHFKDTNRFNALFLPGLPGEYRERPLTNDLANLEFNIYSLTFPGTYDEPGELTPESAKVAIRKAINKIDDTKLPLLIIAYSFSTILVLNCLQDIKKPMGIILFSPLIDLSGCLSIDFKKDIKQLNRTGNFNIRLDSFTQYFTDSINNDYESMLERLGDFKASAFFVIGEQDDLIKTEKVISKFNSYREKRGMNTFSISVIENGGHRLDELYVSGEIPRIIKGLVFAHHTEEIKRDCWVYIWGATLNNMYSSETTDIDLIVLGHEFSYNDYTKLNKLVNRFSNEHNCQIDIIINTFTELQTTKRIRSNRGPSFIHELNYYYLPIKHGEAFVTAMLKSSDIKNDAIFANDMNIYKSRKALLNYPPGSSASNWILKNFLIGCYYHQYLQGNLYIDQNRIHEYYRTSQKSVYEILIAVKQAKRNNYENVDLAFLKKVLITHEELFEK